MHQVSSRRLQLSIVHRLLPAFEVFFSPFLSAAVVPIDVESPSHPLTLVDVLFAFEKLFFFYLLPSVYFVTYTSETKHFTVQ